MLTSAGPWGRQIEMLLFRRETGGVPPFMLLNMRHSEWRQEESGDAERLVSFVCVWERDRTASKLNKYYNFNITSETAESCFVNRVLHCAVYLLLGKDRALHVITLFCFFFLFLWTTSLVVYLWLKTSSLGNLLLLVHYSTSLWCSIRKESKTFRFLWTEHLFRSFFSRFLLVEKCPYPTLEFNLGK